MHGEYQACMGRYGACKQMRERWSKMMSKLPHRAEICGRHALVFKRVDLKDGSLLFIFFNKHQPAPGKHRRVTGIAGWRGL